MSMTAVANSDLFEALYQSWKSDPQTVGEDWRMFFAGFELAMCPRDCVSARRARKQSRVASLIYAYRNQGHLIAQLDPLGNNPASHPDLELEMFGLAREDEETVFDTGHLGGPERATLREIIQHLRETYCGSIGVEYLHIQDLKVRRRLQAQMEPVRNKPAFNRERKLVILEDLIDAEVFEKFLQNRYPGQKRFSLEGAEAFIAAMHSLVHLAPQLGVEEIVIGMAHRGRLNVLTNIMEKSYSSIFSEFEGNCPPDSVGGNGDVKYHLGYSHDHVNELGEKIHISLTSNPSHLEAVDPVVEGRARAKQRQRGDTEERKKVLPLLVHGDAAFSGQGLVAETLNLSQLEGYRTGGTVHFVINNQIGFTALPAESRSSLYSTDVAKMIEAPVFHVNGDDPEALVYVTELALRFRQEFHRDVIVDMICYRRHGHNEADEPAFTQPVLYRKIKDRPSVRTLYTKQLVESSALTSDESRQIEESFRSKLQAAFEEAKVTCPMRTVQSYGGHWKEFNNPYAPHPVATSVTGAELKEVARALTTIPEGFLLNPKVARQLPKQLEAVTSRATVDWAFAELLSMGSLLKDGIPVRLSGQDSQRGTFSQRHAVWYDMQTQERFTPLNAIASGQARFCVYNSLLSEASVLGFEFGYALAEPRMLVLWEAQFGDFANGAQMIIDQFITSSRAKWHRSNGLVMLLPHGYEGQGPEHSNAYLERYLIACAENNMQVCNLSTPAQYFHVLRRQVKRPFRLPLIVMTPKSLLRNPNVVSEVSELVEGGFQEVLDDPAAPLGARRVVLCSGKIYYELEAQRRKTQRTDVALVRVEQFYPFPRERLHEVVSRYKQAGEVFWTQEEPQNRGAWTFMFPRLVEMLPDKAVGYIGRDRSASAATGLLRIHLEEQAEIVATALDLEQAQP